MVKVQQIVGKAMDLGFNKFKETYPEYAKMLTFPIVPATMIESWLMGDKNAYMLLFGKIPNNIPAKPEFVWGDVKDKNSEYPKYLLERVLNEVNYIASRETFCEIAEKIDINELKRTCKMSFGELAEDLQNL